MNQPAFWLKITPAYVIENFESLFSYVNKYNYSVPEYPQSDFNRTADFLNEVALSLIEKANAADLDSTPEWEMGVEKALRIVGTAIVTQNKRGIIPHELIIGLISMLSAVGAVQSEFLESYISTVNACSRKLDIKTFSIGFRDLIPDDFQISKLARNVSKFEWKDDDSLKADYEQHGSVAFTESGITLYPLNLDDMASSRSRTRTIFNTDLDIKFADRDLKKINCDQPQEILSNVPMLLTQLKGVKPSKEHRPKQFTEDGYVDVRIKSISGIKITCESRDPEYEKIAGNLLLDSSNVGVGRDALLNNLSVGDILPAYLNYNPRGQSTFSISDDSDEELDFKCHLLENFDRPYMKAVYLQTYSLGTRWMTESGIQVNILNSNDPTLIREEHGYDGACVKVKINEITTDRQGKVVANGYFLPESEQDEEDVDPDIFIQNANNALARALLSYMKYNDDQPEEPEEKSMKVDSEVVRLVGRLLIKNIDKDKGLSSAERAARLAMAIAFFECVGDQANLNIAQREISFLNLAVNFATGQTPATLKFENDPSIDINERTLELRKAAEVLRKYKERDYRLITSESLEIEMDNLGLVADLVEASNTLIDKIDPVEISRIKKTIARRLGVADVFKDLYRQYTNYGDESDILEFKRSCVQPPRNHKCDTFQGNLDVQAFNILKTVCAFLNSPTGGDLLIGVDDNGYGIGLDDDIERLYTNGIIQERTADRLRIYIKNKLDQAFVTNDGNTSGNSITVGHVLVNVEPTGTSNRQILRVKVTPYPYDVVRIKKDFVPSSWGSDVFYRTSGSSEPLKSDGVRNIKLEKLNRLDRNESKLAIILEAIDRKKQLQLYGYQSSSGRSDRRIEPHKVMPDNMSLQAYDHRRNAMRLFRLSRIDRIEKTDQNWKYEKKHFTLEVDLFGMSQSAEYPGSIVHVKVTNFALMLLKEEHPGYQSCIHFKEQQNKGADKDTFPWVLEMKLFNPLGLKRFAAGLPDYVKIEEEI